jgi:GTP-dependent phosphoenolpyruvate carboxykinase
MGALVLIILVGMGTYFLAKNITNNKMKKKNKRYDDLIDKVRVEEERKAILRDKDAVMSVFNNTTDVDTIDSSIYRLQENEYKMKAWYVDNVRRVRNND